ncbi:hypothetical protein C8R43DRAFT_875006, partial [Mycena crocata]
GSKIYDYFDDCLDQYESYYTGSTRPFHYGIFSAATFYLGCAARYYLDDDLAWGWTALTALGTYDPDFGGHIILWDLNLVVRFPPGSTILIPRALVRYSFVEIAPHETRYLLVQFTPSPVFRFATNGGRSDLKFARKATTKEHKVREEQREAESDGAKGMDMFAHVDELTDNYYIFPIPPNPFTAS